MHRLIAAVNSGNMDDIRMCVAEPSCQINDIRDDNDWTPLHHAVFLAHPNAVLCLLENGADPNAKEQFGGTPLHWACEVEDISLVKLLVANNADLDALDQKARTPLDDALFKRNWEIAEFLSAEGADWKLRSHVFPLDDTEAHKRVRNILEQTAELSPSAAEALNKSSEE